MKGFIIGSIISSMIINPLMLIPSYLTVVYWHTPLIFFIFSVLYIVPTFLVGTLALRKLKVARKKQELKTIAIWTLVGNNPLAGFLMLIIKDEQLNKKKTQPEHA